MRIGRADSHQCRMTEARKRSHVISAKIFVGNLDYATTKDQLTDLFAEVGEVVDVFLPADRVTGKPRGFAFVEFSDSDQAEAAIKQFDEHELSGRKLRINAAQERPRRPPVSRGFDSGPGSGGGGGGRYGKPAKPKGSRRGMRGKKRSL